MIIVMIGTMIALMLIGVFYLSLFIPKMEERHNSLPTVLCIGDSITFGHGVIKSRKKQAWVYILESLSNGKFQTLNYGISGTTLQKEGNQPYMNNFWEKAKAIQPDYIIMMLGTNDSKECNWNAKRYEKELLERIEELKHVLSVKRIFLMVPPFTTPINNRAEVEFGISNEVIFNEIKPIVLRVAENANINTIDLYSVTDGHPEYYTDGVHLNKLGNEIVAEYINEMLAKHLYIY